MSFLPEEELKSKATLNLAPMIDFLFLMLMFFATLAVARNTTKDTNIELVEITPETQGASRLGDADLKILNITINAEGKYQWVTELHDYPLASADELKAELETQHAKGLLPEDKIKTQVLLKIDKQAPWEPVMQALFAVRDAGFDARPVYEPKK